MRLSGSILREWTPEMPGFQGEGIAGAKVAPAKCAGGTARLSEWLEQAERGICGRERARKVMGVGRLQGWEVVIRTLPIYQNIFGHAL